MLFLSGALFPLKGLPAWLAVITRVALLAYDVDPLRHLVFELQNMLAVVAERFATGVTLFGYSLPTALGTPSDVRFPYALRHRDRHRPSPRITALRSWPAAVWWSSPTAAAGGLRPRRWSGHAVRPGRRVLAGPLPPPDDRADAPVTCRSRMTKVTHGWEGGLYGLCRAATNLAMRALHPFMWRCL